jgi:hypothetical protein
MAAADELAFQHPHLRPWREGKQTNPHFSPASPHDTKRTNSGMGGKKGGAGGGGGRGGGARGEWRRNRGAQATTAQLKPRACSRSPMTLRQSRSGKRNSGLQLTTRYPHRGRGHRLERPKYPSNTRQRLRGGGTHHANSPIPANPVTRPTTAPPATRPPMAATGAEIVEQRRTRVRRRCQRTASSGRRRERAHCADAAGQLPLDNL